MLVLSRKRHEEVVIGNNIRVCVIAHQGPRVHLGVSAPAEVTIHREEAYRKITTEPQLEDAARRHD